MRRICFFGLHNYRMLVPGGQEPVNGEAVQQVLLAHAFRDLGFEVSTIVEGGEGPDDQLIDEIRVLRAFNRGDGLPVLRFVHPRMTGALRALRAADADVYYQSPAAVFTGVTAAFCRSRKRRFVFRVASDANCIPGKQLIELWRDRKIFEYGLRRADLIAAQSEHQRALLHEHYGLGSDLVNMVLEEPKERLDGVRDIDVLWISNLRSVKRAETALTVAARLSEYRFVLIGGVIPGSEDYYARIEREASQLENVEFLGQQQFAEVNRYIARSKILLNTSVVEGFPNTFLQAWAREVPVVSYFDPDGIIVREGLGSCPGSEEEMCASLRRLLDDTTQRRKVGEIARAYAFAHFSPRAAAQRYAELLER